MPLKIPSDYQFLCWFAGLSEGEGYFTLTKPDKNSLYRVPKIVVTMKDEDVISHASHQFGMKYGIKRPKYSHWNDIYALKLSGSKTIELLKILFPLMSQRRKTAIQYIFDNYTPPQANLGSNNRLSRLNEAQVHRIKLRLADGETAKSIAKDFDVSHYNIWAISEGKTWRHVTIDDEPAMDKEPDSITPLPVFQNLTDELKLHWLSGLLEAEGTFLRPAPSEPNSPVIGVAMNDEDIIARVAQLFSVNYRLVHARNERHQNHYFVKIKGSRAVDWMKRLYPLLGQRRQAQIDRAISGYTKFVRGKLNEEDVRSIKRRLVNGETPYRIGKDYAVDHHVIERIREGKTWGHITL